MKWSSFFLIGALLLPTMGSAGADEFTYFPEIDVPPVSLGVDSWRGVNIAWQRIPLLTEAGTIYTPDGKDGNYPLHEERISTNVPVRVVRSAKRTVLIWRSYDAEWGVEQVNRAVLTPGEIVMTSRLSFTGNQVPTEVTFRPVLLPSPKNNFKHAQTLPEVDGGPLTLKEADGHTSVGVFHPQDKIVLGEKIRQLTVMTKHGPVAYTFSCSDPDFTLQLSSGEPWRHYSTVLGATGLVGTWRAKAGADRTLSWRIAIRLPGAAATPPTPETILPEHVYLNCDLGRKMAFFHPDEVVNPQLRLTSPQPVDGVELTLTLRDYTNRVIRQLRQQVQAGTVAFDLGTLPVGAYALTTEARRGGSLVGCDVTRLGVMPRLGPALGDRSFFGSFQCYAPLVPEKIALNRWVGIGMVRFREGKQGEFWHKSEPAAGQWVPNTTAVAIAEQYRQAGIGMWYTGDQYPPSTVEFSSNDKKLKNPYPAGLAANQLEFFHYHSRRVKDGFLPRDGKIFQDFVARYVAQFPMIKRYEIMNEPVEEMEIAAAARTIKLASSAIKRVHPNAIIQGMGISELLLGQIQWTDRVLAQAADAIDLISYHHYLSRHWVKLHSGMAFPPIETLGWEEQIRQIATVAKKYNKPYCNSELTWLGCPKETWPDREFNQQEKNSAETFVRSYLLEKAGGAQSVTLCFGSTIRPAGVDYSISVERGAALLGMRHMVKPWAVAHAVLADLMEGATFLGSIKADEKTVRLLHFRGRQGVWAVIWNYAETGSAKLPFTPDEVELRDLVGGVFQADNGIIKIDGSPIYLVNRKLTPERFAAGLRQIKVQPAAGVRIVKFNLDPNSHQRLLVTLENRGGAAVRVKYLGYKNTNPDIVPFLENFVVEPGIHEVELPVRLAVSVPMTIRIELKGEVTGQPFYSAYTEQMALPAAAVADRIGALPIVRAAPAPRFDGRIDDPAWNRAPWIILDQAGQVGTDPGIKSDWLGPQDLSVRAKLLWDRRNLYFLAEVRDDRHVNRQQDMTAASWASDAIQLAFDLKSDSVGGYNVDDHEINLALWQDRPVMWHRLPFGRAVADGKLQVTRSDDLTVYQAAIPLTELTPWRGECPLGRIIRFNFIVNDDDGKEKRRTKWIGLTGGIGETKNPALYRKFLFIDQPGTGAAAK